MVGEAVSARSRTNGREGRTTLVMRVVGYAGVIGGGLVAAVADPLDVYRGSWVAAFLVLVIGAAQVAMSAARQRWGAAGAARSWWQIATWNVGGAGVIVGTLAETSVVVYVFSLVMVVALVIAFADTWGRPPAEEARIWLLIYRIVLIVLALSIPVGMLLSYLRHSA